MNRYVDSTEQLVTEIVVREIARSTAFYRRLGFSLLRDGGDFVELTWEEHRLFLAELSAFQGVDPMEFSEPPRFPRANIRVMVPRVDEYWRLALESGPSSFRSAIDITVCAISRSPIRMVSAFASPARCRP